jgi:hypothetical protein
MWTKTYGSTRDDFCNSVALCKDGGFLLGGSTDSSGTNKIYYLKTDSSGNATLTHIDIPSIGGKSVSRIRETLDGQYITLGWTNSSGGGSKDISWATWNTGGWYLNGTSFGGVNEEEAYDIELTKDSGFVIVGFTGSYGTGPDNIVIIKINHGLAYNPIPIVYVSVNEISEKNENTLIYPNPFSENLFLEIDRNFFIDEKDFIFEIADLCGRKIMSMEKNIASYSLGSIQIEIPSEKFTPGFYLASLQSGNKKIYRKLLFVK